MAFALVILQRRVLEVRIDDAILDYIVGISEATRRSEELSIGLSPRGSLALTQAARAAAMLEGRDYVVPDDVKNLAPCVCAHRLLTDAIGHDSASSASDEIFRRILETVPVPE